MEQVDPELISLMDNPKTTTKYKAAATSRWIKKEEMWSGKEPHS